MDSNYPSTWDEKEAESSQACSVWRKIYHDFETLELKFGKDHSYEVTTGYKIYEAGNEEPIAEGTGEPFTMELEGATQLYFYAATLALMASQIF